MEFGCASRAQRYSAFVGGMSHLVFLQPSADCKSAVTRSAYHQILADAEVDRCPASMLEFIVLSEGIQHVVSYQQGQRPYSWSQ